MANQQPPIYNPPNELLQQIAGSTDSLRDVAALSSTSRNMRDRLHDVLYNLAIAKCPAAFIDAVWDGNIAAVTKFIERGVDVDTRISKESELDPSLHHLHPALGSGSNTLMGPTALHIAVWRGNYDMVKLLLEHKANPNIMAAYNTFGRYISKMLTRDLLRQHPDLHISTSAFKLPIPDISGAGTLHMAREWHHDLEVISVGVLFVAIQSGRINIITLLLNSRVHEAYPLYGAGAHQLTDWNGTRSPPASARDRRCTLHLAAMLGQTEVVKALLTMPEFAARGNTQRGIDCRAPSTSATPLWFAYVMGHMDVVRLLAVSGRADVDVELRQGKGFTPLVHACLYNRWDDAIALVELGARTDIVLIAGPEYIQDALNDTHRIRQRAAGQLPDIISSLGQEETVNGMRPLEIVCRERPLYTTYSELNTDLHRAVPGRKKSLSWSFWMSRRIELIRTLVEHGAPLGPSPACPQGGTSALGHLAGARRLWEMLQLIAQARVNRAHGAWDFGALANRADHPWPVLTGVFFSRNDGGGAAPPFRRPPFRLADAVALLLQHGAPVNFVSTFAEEGEEAWGRTVLHSICTFWRRIEQPQPGGGPAADPADLRRAVTLLFDHGADVLVTDVCGKSVLHYALQYQAESVIARTVLELFEAQLDSMEEEDEGEDEGEGEGEGQDAAEAGLV